MLNVEQIAEWRGQEVLDSDGERVGKLDEVIYGARTGDALLALVKHGMLGRRSTLIPLKDATVGRDYVRVAFSAEQVGGAGEVDSAAGIDAQRAAEIFTAYGLQFEAEDLESSEQISQRRQAAEEAAARADELDAEVDARAERARELRERADQAGAEADAAERDLRQTKADAAEAHGVMDEGRSPETARSSTVESSD